MRSSPGRRLSGTTSGMPRSCTYPRVVYRGPGFTGKLSAAAAVASHHFTSSAHGTPLPNAQPRGWTSSRGRNQRHDHPAEMGVEAMSSTRRFVSAPTAEPRARAAVASSSRRAASQGLSAASTGGSPAAGFQAARDVAGRIPYGWSPIRTGGTGPSGSRLSSAHAPASCVPGPRPRTFLSPWPKVAAQIAATSARPGTDASFAPPGSGARAVGAPVSARLTSSAPDPPELPPVTSWRQASGSRPRSAAGSPSTVLVGTPSGRTDSDPLSRWAANRSIGSPPPRPTT